MLTRTPMADPCRLRRLHGRSRDGREDGSTTIELAILIVVVFALVFGTIQTTLWFHARNVASSAAQVAVQTARTYDGSAGAGQGAGLDHLAGVGGVQGASVTVTRGATTTTATVRGSVAPLVPGMPLPAIQVQAQAATERLTP